MDDPDDRDEQSERDLLDESTLGLHVELRPGKALSQAEEPPAVEEADWPQFRRLALLSVQASLCPRVPFPSLDNGAVSGIRRRMVQGLGEDRRLELSEDEVRVLAGDRHQEGVLAGAAQVLRRGVGTILSRISRALHQREGVDRAVETFVEGYLLLYAAGLPQALRPAGRTPERVRAVRAAVASTLAEVDVTPIRASISRSFQGGLGPLTEAAGEVPLSSKEEELLGGIVDELAGALWADQEHLDSLERAFDERFARKRPLQ